MRREITIRFLILAVVALAAFLMLRSSSVKPQPATKGCKEECCQKKCDIPDENMIWESFSRQLISITLLPQPIGSRP